MVFSNDLQNRTDFRFPEPNRTETDGSYVSRKPNGRYQEPLSRPSHSVWQFPSRDCSIVGKKLSLSLSTSLIKINQLLQVSGDFILIMNVMNIHVPTFFGEILLVFIISLRPLGRYSPSTNALGSLVRHWKHHFPSDLHVLSVPPVFILSQCCEVF